MSLNIKKADGSLQKIAGNTVILDATTSEVRSGAFSLSGGTGWAVQNITFTTPMPDTDYVVNIELANAYDTVGTPFRITNKTVNGFTLAIWATTSTLNYTGTYYAFRLIELEGYTEIQNKIANPDTMPTENSTNLVESGGVYEMIKNASSVFIGTAAEWAIETDKESYQLAVITDTDTINTVNSTTGATDPVADYTGAWTGTTAEWAALSASEKAKYKIVNITDDYDGGDGSPDYSTTETNTGKKWIDGKPIYRLVIESQQTMAASNTWYNTHIPKPNNLQTLTYCFIGSAINAVWPAMANFSTNELRFWFETGNTFIMDYVILEYTKTTD